MKNVNNELLAKNIATVDQAVQFIIKNLDDSWREKLIATTGSEDLIKFHWTLGIEIKNMLNLEDKNSELNKSCVQALRKKTRKISMSNEELSHPDCISFFLITELAKALKK